MNKKNLLTKSALATAVALLSANASAAGYQIGEHSASGLGRAFAGEGAVADNAAVVIRNPAAMMMFDAPSISGGLTYIDPAVDVNGTTGGPLKIPANASDIAPSAVVPFGAVIYPINEQWALGGALFSNYGLATDFPTDFSAGFLGGKTDLMTVNANLSAAYRINQQFSLGLGLNAVYADAELVRHAGVLTQVPALPGANGPQKNPLYKAPASTEIAYLKGDTWAFGWNIGAMWEINEANRLALTYRSKVKLDFDGDFRGVTSQTVPANLKVDLPDIWEISGYSRLNQQFALSYGIMRTGWDSFKELKATSSQCKDSVCLQKDENFETAYRYALGGTYYYSPEWTFRAGFAYDQKASSKHPSISIPDQDRVWYTLGTTYAFDKNLSVDAGFAYLNGRGANFKEDFGPVSSQFESKGDAYLYSVGLNYTF
ncbi:outer membrane protein transport protein [Plesiomonas shigelloides]|uniref:outer membrane protein transport protein n=1 Tax=Plesiomonas shigelloides TaxID=703 RepID=UPI0022485BDC|nr:outer membrane protein transport protein [Plesiomonas shigelloides]MCX2533287.1 outer membrane protein transport protein [Plesiomonas shigelloides]